MPCRAVDQVNLRFVGVFLFPRSLRHGGGIHFTNVFRETNHNNVPHKKLDGHPESRTQLRS